MTELQILSYALLLLLVLQLLLTFSLLLIAVRQLALLQLFGVLDLLRQLQVALFLLFRLALFSLFLLERSLVVYVDVLVATRLDFEFRVKVLTNTAEELNTFKLNINVEN